MPSLRRTLNTRQMLIALYSDPATYAVANRAARARGAQPGTPGYAREMTYFLLDLESRVHTSRVKVGASLKDRALWQLRRKLVRRVTGEDLLPAVAPSIDAVARWRSRLLPTQAGWTDEDTGAERTLTERLAALDAAYADGIPEVLEEIRDSVEAQSVRLALVVGQYPQEADENHLSPLGAHNTVMADGTWIRPFSGVEAYQLNEDDPDTGETTLETKYAGSRAGGDRTRRVSASRPNDKKHGPKVGVLHTAVLTESPYGRIVHTLDRTFGSEVDASLDGFARVADRIPGRIRALAYDKAFDGWHGDHLVARHGAVPVVPPKAEVAAEKVPDNRAAADLAREILDQAYLAATHLADAARGVSVATKTVKKPLAPTEKVKSAVASRILGEMYADEVKQLRADAEAGRPLGRGLPVGTSMYLSSGGALVVVASANQAYLVDKHTVDGEECEHPLFLDDGALWSTTLGLRGRVIKEQRLECINLKRLWVRYSRRYELAYTYQFVCERTGEVRTHRVDIAPKTRRSSSGRGRTARDDMRHVAPCDPAWRGLYGLRNNTESWFSWLKDRFPQHQRAASLDLNHQFLDVLHAAMLTNSVTRYHYLMEGGC